MLTSDLTWILYYLHLILIIHSFSLSKIITNKHVLKLSMAFINNRLSKNKGNWLTDKPGFMVTCDIVSGSLEGCPDIKIIYYHQTGDLKSWDFSFIFWPCLGKPVGILHFGILEHFSSCFLWKPSNTIMGTHALGPTLKTINILVAVTLMSEGPMSSTVV